MVNEHYVPKFFLDLFSPDNEGLISRYSLAEKHEGGDYYDPRNRYSIRKAASSEDYADEILEKDETNLAEREMANAIDRVLDNETLNERDIAHLAQFLIFQRDRSPRAKFFHQTMANLSEFTDRPEPSRWENVMAYDAAEGQQSLQFLGWRIIENHSDTPFVTSDCPVVNYLPEHPGVQQYTMESREIFCPLGPNHLLLLLDPATFEVDQQYPSTEIERLQITTSAEVHRFNLLQGISSFRELFGPVGQGDMLERIVEVLCEAFPDDSFIRGTHASLNEIQSARKIASGQARSDAERRWYQNIGKKIVGDQDRATRAIWEFDHGISLVDRLERDSPDSSYWE